jgi:hypothetical protein
MHRARDMRLAPVAAAMAAACSIVSIGTSAQTSTPPRVELVTAPRLRLPGQVDSNSPAIWDRVGGRDTLFVMTSANGTPKTASGRGVDSLGAARAVVLDPWPGGGVWIEAVVADVDGTWYGYYHNENLAEQCGTTEKVIPRIGASSSRNRGRAWQSLGIVLESPPNGYTCSTTNRYFVGGVGDFSVQLDADSRYLYFFFSQYGRQRTQQGIGVARLAWADRDSPAGKITVWRSRTWFPASSQAGLQGESLWLYPSAVPIFPAAESWHDNDTEVDAFWGPSVHWNTYLRQYVMLLNRAKDADWTQEGIYISYAPRLDDPRLWSQPVKILDGGSWYPQVIGLEAAIGTDKVAGQHARFFVSGVSRHLIQFIR